MNGITIPEQIDLNLPPGSVYKAASQVGISMDNGSLQNLEEEMLKINEKNQKKQREFELIIKN